MTKIKRTAHLKSVERTLKTKNSDSFSPYSKGVVNSMAMVLLVILTVFFTFSFLTTINSELGRRESINIRETEILRLINTFNLLNKSLGVTWHVSTVQSVFNASDQSLNCGIDEAKYRLATSSGIADILPPKYFYQYDRTKQKDIKGLKQYLVDRDAGQKTKYNDFEPAVCYPTDADAIDVIKTAFAKYKNIFESFTVNNVEVAINEDSITNDIRLTSSGVFSATTQSLSLSTTNGKIEETTTNNNIMFTEFSKMPAFARKLVSFLASFSDLFTDDTTNTLTDTVYDPRYKYQDLNTLKNTVIPLVCADTLGKCDVGNETYLNRIATIFPGGVGLDTTIKLYTATDFRQTKADIKKNKYELTAAKSTDTGVFGRSTSRTDGSGLILHYDYSVNLNNFNTFAADTNECNLESQDAYKPIILIAMELGGDPSLRMRNWEFRSVKYTEDEILSFLSAIFQQESNWNPLAVSPNCGAAGLGQFMPGTAKLYGMTNIFEGSSIITCDKPYSDRLEAAIAGKTLPEAIAIDDRFDPQKNIRGSAKYINSLLTEIIIGKQYTSDREEALKLAAAAYNTGPGNLQRAVDNAVLYDKIDRNNVKFDQIAKYLHIQTQEYVPKVMGHYICYGGFVSLLTDGYYYHDEAANKFTKRPVSMEVKVEDYLPAIDCLDQPYNVAPDMDVNEKAFFNSVRFFSWGHEPTPGLVRIKVPSGSGRALENELVTLWQGDMVCCGLKLFSCNADVPDLPTSQKLTGGRITDSVCDDALNRVNPGKDNPDNPICYSLQCAADGFVIVPSAC